MYTHIIATQDATLWKPEKCFCAPVLTLASVCMPSVLSRRLAENGTVE